mmetsp:Transcript_7446/g.19110  ORF Transcript_7446/g.19110 Transcript_7446/m.19110 type:complete len:282 (+) Transcript_7446:129-974(+)
MDPRTVGQARGSAALSALGRMANCAPPESGRGALLPCRASHRRRKVQHLVAPGEGQVLEADALVLGQQVVHKLPVRNHRLPAGPPPLREQPRKHAAGEHRKRLVGGQRGVDDGLRGLVRVHPHQAAAVAHHAGVLRQPCLVKQPAELPRDARRRAPLGALCAAIRRRPANLAVPALGGTLLPLLPLFRLPRWLLLRDLPLQSADGRCLAPVVLDGARVHHGGRHPVADAQLKGHRTAPAGDVQHARARGQRGSAPEPGHQPLDEYLGAHGGAELGHHSPPH